MKRLFAAAALLAALPMESILAAPMPGAEIQARSTGGEFRGFGSTRRRNLEDMIWRLRADGSVRSVSSIRKGGRDSGGFIEYQDAGTWRVEGDRLCMQFANVHGDLSGCYSVDGTGGDHVRLVGPVVLEGTLSR